MPYCPECLTEYAEGSRECPDCDVALQPGTAPAVAGEDGKSLRLVRIRTFSGPTAQLDADLAKNILQEEGIVCMLPGEFSAEALPGIDQVQLLVREEDATQAAEILESFLDNLPDSLTGEE